MLIWPLSEKKRNNFLRYTYNANQHVKIRLIENLSIAICFTILMGISGYGIYSLLTIIIGCALSFHNKMGDAKLKIPTPFSKKPFEFPIGFRQYFLLLVFQFVLIGIGFAVNNYNLTIVVYASIFLVLMSFYSTMEEYFFVWIHDDTPTTFINKKITTGVKYSLYVCTIPFIILLAVYPHHIGLTLAVTSVGVFYIAFATVLKYAQYPHVLNLTNIIVTFISIGFPFFMLITIPYYYKKAVQNLKLELL